MNFWKKHHRAGDQEDPVLSCVKREQSLIPQLKPGHRHSFCATVALKAEQAPCKGHVEGSNPSSGSTKKPLPSSSLEKRTKKRTKKNPNQTQQKTPKTKNERATVLFIVENSEMEMRIW